LHAAPVIFETAWYKDVIILLQFLGESKY